jgi:hypothetical protein
MPHILFNAKFPKGFHPDQTCRAINESGVHCSRKSGHDGKHVGYTEPPEDVKAIYRSRPSSKHHDNTVMPDYGVTWED